MPMPVASTDNARHASLRIEWSFAEANATVRRLLEPLAAGTPHRRI